MSALILCAGGNENFSFAKAIGIGMVQASIKTTELCMQEKPNELIFIGTCGLYDKGELLKIYQSSYAFNVEYSSLANSFYSPIKNEISLNVSYETSHKTNSSNYICQNKEAAKNFAKLGLELENMELFSVLCVAKYFDIKARGILCATNFCDEKAHETFLKNHKEAKEILENFLRERKLI